MIILKDFNIFKTNVMQTQPNLNLLGMKIVFSFLAIYYKPKTKIANPDANQVR